MPLGFGALGSYALAEIRRAAVSAATGIHTITSDDVLQLPIDCVLMANQPYEKSGKTSELPHDRSIKTKRRFFRSGLKKL